MNCNDITFIYPFRMDIEDRVDNLSLSIRFLRKYCSNLHIVVVEHDKESNLSKYPEVLKLIDKYEYINDESVTSHTYNKGISINHAVLNLTKRPIIVALDTDTIVHPDYINMARTNINKQASIPVGSVVCYNGTCILTSKKVKDEFRKDLSYSLFLKLNPSTNNQDAKIVNNNSMGGVCMFRRERFIEFGGFNPCFKGWGCEDIEIYERMKIMNMQVLRVNHPNALLWHLDHEGTIKGENINFRYNENIAQQVFKIRTSQDMRDYIWSWKQTWNF